MEVVVETWWLLVIFAVIWIDVVSYVWWWRRYARLERVVRDLTWLSVCNIPAEDVSPDMEKLVAPCRKIVKDAESGIF